MISKVTPPHPQFPLISDLDGLSVEVNIRTGYFITAVEDYLKIVISVLTGRFLNNLLWIWGKTKQNLYACFKKNVVIIKIQFFEGKVICYLFFNDFK